MQMQIFLGFMAIAALIYIVGPSPEKTDEIIKQTETKETAHKEEHGDDHHHDDHEDEDDHHDHDHEDHDDDDHHHHHDEEHVQHYEIKEPKDIAEARSIMSERISKIATILTKPKLEVADLELVHEHSYSLEAAIDKIRDEKAAPEEIIDHVDEAIQALHYGSEKHEEDTTREWFSKLQKAIVNL